MKRQRIGTYPIWLAKTIKIVGRFGFKLAGFKADFFLRGRGERSKTALKAGRHRSSFNRDLPLYLAKKAAIYLTLTSFRQVKMDKLKCLVGAK